MKDTRDVGDQLVAAAGRLTELLGSVPDGAAVARPTTWSITQTAAHVVAELTDHADLAESGAPPVLGTGPAWTRGREANAAQLAAAGDLDLAALSSQVLPAAHRAVDVLRAVDGEVWSTNGLRWTGVQTLQMLLGEQLVHGLDVARAAGRRWPITRAEALEVAAGSIAVLPDYLKPAGVPDRRLSYEIRLRGGPSYRFTVAGDTATVGPAGERADCVVSADPVAFLTVGYGRSKPTVAALSGKVLAHGRRPWLGLRFGQLLAAP